LFISNQLFLQETKAFLEDQSIIMIVIKQYQEAWIESQSQVGRKKERARREGRRKEEKERRKEWFY